MTRLALNISILGLGLVSACALGGGTDDDYATTEGGSVVIEGEDALALLRLVNHASYEELDAIITSTAAKNIVAYRKGSDRTAGTADDRVFTTVKEVDAVKSVGPQTLADLRDDAIARYLPAWNAVVFPNGLQVTLPVSVVVCNSPNADPAGDQCQPAVQATSSGLIRVEAPSVMTVVPFAPCTGVVIPHTGAFSVSCHASGCGTRSCWTEDQVMSGTIADQLVIDTYTSDRRSGNQALGFQAEHRSLSAPAHIDP